MDRILRAGPLVVRTLHAESLAGRILHEGSRVRGMGRPLHGTPGAARAKELVRVELGRKAGRCLLLGSN